MPVTATTGPLPENTDPEMGGTVPRQNHPPAVDELPPLPAFNDTHIQQIASQFSSVALDVAGLTSSREVDEKSERELLWRLISVPEDAMFIGGETIPNEVFSTSLRVTLMGYIRDLNHHEGTVTAKRLWEFVVERASTSIYFGSLQQELLLIFQAYTGRTIEVLLEALLKVFRARTIAQSIFRETADRYERGEDVDTLIAHIEELVVELSQQGGRRRRSFKDTVRAVHKQLLYPDKTRAGLATGLRDFDRQFGGIKRDRVVTIGGYTGSGKTALLIDLIYRLLFYHKDKVAIKFFSFEMSEERIVQRLFSRAAMVSVKRQDDWWVKVKYIRDEDGKEVEEALMEPLSEREIHQINQALPFLESLDEAIDVEYGGYNIENAERECKRFALKNKGKHLIYLFDHLDLFEGEDRDNRIAFNNRMKMCKNVARSLDATVIPLVQLAKGVESRFNREDHYRPSSEYIMESVGVEAASDIVLLLWRPSKQFENIPYVNLDLGIRTSNDDDPEYQWDCRHRLIAVNVKNRDGASFTDLVFDADMAHSKLYNYNELRRIDPDLFKKVATGELFGGETYLTGEAGGAQFRGPVQYGVPERGQMPSPYKPGQVIPEEPDLPF